MDIVLLSDILFAIGVTCLAIVFGVVAWIAICLWNYAGTLDQKDEDDT